MNTKMRMIKKIRGVAELAVGYTYNVTVTAHADHGWVHAYQRNAKIMLSQAELAKHFEPAQ